MIPVDLGADTDGTEKGLLELKEVEYEASVFVVVEDEYTVPEILSIMLLLYEGRELLLTSLPVNGVIVLSSSERIASVGTALAEERVLGVEIQVEAGLTKA